MENDLLTPLAADEAITSGLSENTRNTFHSTYRNFRELVQGLDGYIDELSPYPVDLSQTIFPKLPTELSWQIYSYLTPPGLNPVEPGTLWEIERHPVYPILRINESTRIHAGLYFLNKHSFALYNASSRDRVIRFLESFPGEQGFWAIRKLDFRFFSDQVSIPKGLLNDNMHFIGRCSGLRFLYLRFDSKHLLRLWNSNNSIKTNWTVAVNDDYALITPEQLILMYQLRDLLKLNVLEKVNLGLSFNWAHRTMGVNDEWRVLDYMALLQEVGNCLENEFSYLGRYVEFTYIEPRHSWFMNFDGMYLG